MKILAIILGTIGCICLVGLMYVGSVAPETSIYTGKQIPKKFLTTINDLNVLKKGEDIKYFYSDSLLDIKDGFYLVSDQSLILYSSEWDEPAVVIPLAEITKVEANYDDSFFEDSTVFVETDKLEIAFPLSSEKGLDKKFVRAIKEKMLVTEEQNLRGHSPSTK